MIRVRFAVAPAGYLCLGAARVALANALFARRHAGEMVLRLDDADAEHCRPDYADAIMQDLAWLGIIPDRIIRQSERSARYVAAIERLKQAGRLYPCFESEQELRAKRDRRLKRGQPAAYDRTMLHLTEAQRAAAEAGGKRPYWRFRLSDTTEQWNDVVLGPRTVKLPAVSDPVLVRADGAPSRLLAGSVDDIELGVSHVIETEDRLTGTGLQRDVMAALGADPRCAGFAHLPSLGDGGGRLARRAATRTLRSVRADGIESEPLAACLARFGSPLPPELLPLDGLAASFELAAMTYAPARFDAEQLLALNRCALAQSAFAAVADRLPLGATEAFWLAVRQHLDLLTEARGWWDVVAGTIVPPVIEGGQEILPVALRLLPLEPWSSGVCADWVGAICRTVGRAPEAVLRVLRLALTGEELGPELADLLPLIGRTRTANRLQFAAA